MSKDNLEESWALGQGDEEHDTITLTLEDDSQMECLVLTTLTVDEKDYIALLPLEEEEEEDGTVFLYQYVQNGEEDIELINIENDDEFEKVSDAFDAYLDTLEFNEVFGDEEE